MAGIDSTGFTPKSLDDIKTGLNAVWRTVFGASVNVDPRSRNGQIIAAAAGALSEAWNLGASIFNAFSRPSGVLLDYISALTGTVRKPAMPSTVTLTRTGTTGNVVPAGKVASVSGTTAQFQTLASSTLVAATAWASSHTYSTAGVRVKNAGSIYQVITPGVSAGSGGPAGIGADILDGTVHWRFLGPGDGVVDVAAACTVTGPVQGYAFTINTIATPVAGWSGVINLLDAVPGSNVETDPQLRVRRATEAAGQGRSPLDSLRAQVFKVAGVTSVFVFENTTDGVIDGTAAHSVEVLVNGGTDAAVAAAIFANKAAGPGSSGTSSVTVTDTELANHTIFFSRPVELDIYETITVAVDVTMFPANGTDLIRDALVAVGNALGQGKDVYARAVEAAIFAKDSDGALLIPGVLDVQSHFVGTAPSPGTTSVGVTIRQFSKFDTSRTIVTIVPGTP
jgi:uncharacterized phage protein gp47/JayE